MAILQSCCFWNGVRNGSYASAIYTLIYFGLSTIVFVIYANDEQEFLTGKRERPVGESLFEKGDITATIVIFNMLFLCCSTLLFIASVLLIIGLRLDKRLYLVPWIVMMQCDVLIEIAHLIYLIFCSERVKFEPIVAFMFTIDFFIMSLNCYCVVCVISQYQEYKAGRGCRPIKNAVANSLRVESANATEETPSCLKTFPCNSQSTAHKSPFATQQRRQHQQQQQQQQLQKQQQQQQPLPQPQHQSPYQQQQQQQQKKQSEQQDF